MTQSKIDRKLHETLHYAENPFITKKDLNIKTSVGSKVGETDYKLVDAFGSTLDSKVILATEVLTDKEPYMKFFGDLSYLLDLSKTGLKALVYIAERVEFDQDIVIASTSAMIENGFSRRSAFGGIKELLDNDILAKTKIAGIYYINPHKIFRGKRRFLYMKGTKDY